jgi:PAS domain S-box-containing protein
LIEEISDGVLILNPDMEVLFFNDPFLRIIGWSSNEVFDDLEYFPSRLGLLPLREGNRSALLRGPNESEVFVFLKCVRVDTQSGFYYMVTVKPHTLLAPEVHRQHYELLLQDSGDALFSAGFDGRLLDANDAFYSMLEFGNGKAVPQLPELYVYRDDYDDKLRRLLSEGFMENCETHLYTGERRMRRILDTSRLLKNGDGEPIGYVSQFKDITYLRNIESRLKISERNFTILFDTILSSIIILDLAGMILNVNSAAEKIYGYSWEEFVGSYYDTLLRADREQPDFLSLLERVHREGGTYIQNQVPRRRRNGNRLYTYASITGVRDISGEVIAYSLAEKDLTERVRLEQKLRDSFQEIKETQSAAIIGFAKLTEYRDKDTGTHLERIREFTRILALALRSYPQYRDYITDDYLEDLTLSSILHDVGKVGIEDSILLKPGKLSQQEYERIMRHSNLGGEALEVVDRKLKKKSFLTMGKEIARYHHERWDGNGYPEGLRGEQIPLSARIVAVADVYDALTSRRPYKEAYSHQEAVEEIVRCSGSQFDPEIVEVFRRNAHIFERIRRFTVFEEHPEAAIRELVDEAKQHVKGHDGRHPEESRES